VEIGGSGRDPRVVVGGAAWTAAAAVGVGCEERPVPEPGGSETIPARVGSLTPAFQRGCARWAVVVGPGVVTGLPF
jgi:hypothetical protein